MSTLQNENLAYLADFTQEQKMMYLSLSSQNNKSVGASIAFWFFFGGWGAHFFYLNETGLAFGQIAFVIFTGILIIPTHGFICILALIIGLIQLMLLPSITHEANDKKNRRVIENIIALSSTGKSSQQALEKMNSQVLVPQGAPVAMGIGGIPA